MGFCDKNLIKKDRIYSLKILVPVKFKIDHQLSCPAFHLFHLLQGRISIFACVFQVLPEWDEYEDTVSGRKFYYNTLTKEKSWKPPRKSKGNSEGSLTGSTPCVHYVLVSNIDVSAGSILVSPEPTPTKAEEKEGEVQTPNGYEKKTDGTDEYFVNIFTGVRWFSAKDDAGKVYFYEENGNESCWSLPNVSQTIQDSVSQTEDNEDDDVFERETKEEGFKGYTLPVSTPNIQIGNITIVVVKQGPLHKTKLLENGKKHRKNWTSSHVVLTDTLLLFFKDSKAFGAMQSGSSNTKPDHCVDLKGAEANWCKEKSRRSNVFEVTTLLGLTMLLQYDILQVAAEWFEQISEIINKLNMKSVQPTPGLAIMRSNEDLVCSTMPKRGSRKVNRTKSFKTKILGSTEDLCLEDPGVSSSSHSFGTQNRNIRERLKKLFLLRPSMDDLFRRGIIKNEPVFGSTLQELQATDLSDIPVFVKKCVSEIEKGERLKADGVYRQSGNLSTIQKIRFQVDQGNIAILETVDDVHVLTGALKLFFRELKEPLIPWEIVNKLLLAANNQSRKRKIQEMKKLVSSMPNCHRQTLHFLLSHLVKVTQFKDKNRMQFSNLAIVFGPTLMWPPPSSVSFNLALDMMQQNIIVEALLNNVDQLF